MKEAGGWVWALTGVVGGVLLLFTWQTFESFNTPKEALLKVGAVTLLLGVLWGWLRRASVQWPWGAVIGAAVTLWGWGWASWLVSPHPELTVRAQLFLLHLLLLMGLLPVVLADGPAIARMWRNIAVIGGLVALLGVAQQLGVDYEQGIRFVRPSAILPKTEIYSTIGNPNYLAAVMAFLLPVTAALARVPQADGGMGRGWRMLLWASALCSGVAVILSRSKGGLVAVVAGLVFFLLLLAHAEQWTMKRLLAAAGRWLAAGLLVLAVAGGLMLGMGTVDALTTEWARLSHLSWEAPTIKGRLLMWQTAARMIAAHPVVGIGAGTFGAQYQPYRAQVFDRVTEPAAVYPASEPSYNETGQVHNDYLQLAAETGLVGLALFVTLVVLCYRCGLGLLRDPRATALTPLARSLLCGLLAGIAVILTHALMDFPLSQPVAALLFWLAVGTVVAFAVQAAGSGHRLQQWRPQWLQWGWARWGVGVVGLFLAMAFMAQAVRPVVAGAYQREAWLLLSQQRWAAAASTAEKGLSWDAANSELLLYLGAAQYQQGHLDGSRAAYQQYQLLYRDFQTLYNLGLIAVKEEDFSKADAYFLEALRYKPTLAEAAMQLAVVAERTGRPDEARRWRRQAARLRGIG